MSSLQYRKEIDGLRAIAVLPVVLFHYNSDWLPGGFIGVDVFFVISGFLITSIIIDQNARGQFSFLSFWKRRIKRILPALTVVVLVTLFVGSIMLYGPDVSNLGSQGLAALLSYANISHLLLAGNYWGHEAENSPLLHTWSLSVEEQYYLIFPLTLVLVLRYASKRVTVILLAFCLISFLLFLVGSKTNPTLTFYLLPTRAWELGVGGLLALTMSKFFKEEHSKGSILSSIGLIFVLISYFALGGDESITRYLFVPVMGVALVIAFSRSQYSMANRFLSLWPLVFIGKISYSVYLWHWPVLVFSRPYLVDVNGVVSFLLVYFVIFCLSIASYYLVEAPARNSERALPFILVGILFAITCSFLLKTSDFEENTSMFSSTEWHGNLYSVNPNQAWSESAKKRLRGIKLLPSDPEHASVYDSGGIQKKYGVGDPDIVLLGDSHALMWAKVLDEIAYSLSTSISFYSVDGTPPFFDIPPTRKSESLRYFTQEQKFKFDIARLEYLAKWRPKVVVIVSRWEKQTLDDSKKLVEYIGELGSKVVLIEQPPVLFFGNKNAPQYLSYLKLFPQISTKQYVPETKSEQFEEGIKLVDRLVSDNDFVSKIQVSDIFSVNDQAWVLDSNDVLYVDEDHLSYKGALKAKSRIEKHLIEALGMNE